MQDIKEEIDKWKEDGDQILLTGYFNDYILSQISRQLSDRIGLRELTTEKHGEEGSQTNR